jgi:hypothetical protein
MLVETLRASAQYDYCEHFEETMTRLATSFRPRNIPGAAFFAALLALAGCGASEPATAPLQSASFDPAAAIALGEPTWRTGVETGHEVGEVAYALAVALRDGSTATLAEIAAGKPILLYFFATW